MRLNISRTLILNFFFSMAATLLTAGVSMAQPMDYFPLQVGNSWLYRIAQGENPPNPDADEFRSISVDSKESIRGRDYFRVTFFGRTVHLRPNSDGSIVSLNFQSGTEDPWLSLNLPAGSSFPTTIDRCTTGGRIESREEQVSTPAGQFTNAVQVSFQARCADTGITGQHYAPQIGMLRHEETTFVGPRPYELVYFRVGPLNMSRPEISFTVALDAAQYKTGGQLAARLTLRSTLPNATFLRFPSGQSFDLKIYNNLGEVIYVWSDGRVFPLIYREEWFGPGERNYAVTAPLRNFAPGRYKAQAYLTTDPQVYLGEVSFEIVP